MLYKLGRDDFKNLISHEFSKKYLEGQITLKQFNDWLDGFRQELQKSKVKPSSIKVFQDLIIANSKNLLFFELFDGTKIPTNGQILNKVLLELGKYQEILIYPEPGERDIFGYRFCSEIVKYSYKKNRKQIDLTALSNLLIRTNIIDDNPFSNKIFIFDSDMYTPGRTNWCYGQVQPISTNQFGRTISFDMLFCSTARIHSEALLYDLFAHEIGHILNVAPPERTNTNQELGSHCTNHLCVMQQKGETGEASQYARLRQRSGAPLYCQQCLSDIKRFKSNFSLRDTLKIRFQ